MANRPPHKIFNKMGLFGNTELYSISEDKDANVASAAKSNGSRPKSSGLAKATAGSGRTGGLSNRTKFGFSLGHFFNDMSSSVWFSYSLLFFKLYLSNSMAGALILVGQVADALATPFIGYYSDKQKCNAQSFFLFRLGRRKFWHMLGTVLLLISYPLVYIYPLLFPEGTDVFRYFNFHLCLYVLMIALFQSSWAMVQVSHVSLITDLTSIQNERVALNAYR